MDRIFVFRIRWTFLVIIVILVTFPIVEESSQQTEDQLANNYDNGVRVVVTLFGVNEDTGKVAVIVKVHNMTEERLVNASSEYGLRNRTGVIDIYFQIANQSVQVGEKITACIVVFQVPQMVCNIGFNSPGIRTEFIQLLSPNT